MRICTYCQRKLDNHALLERECRDLEAARREQGLEGLRFRYYNCPRCGHDSLFLVVFALPWEAAEDFASRERDLKTVVDELAFCRTSIVIASSAGCAPETVERL
jgi:hypothetical protein